MFYASPCICKYLTRCVHSLKIISLIDIIIGCCGVIMYKCYNNHKKYQPKGILIGAIITLLLNIVSNSILYLFVLYSIILRNIQFKVML